MGEVGRKVKAHGNTKLTLGQVLLAKAYLHSFPLRQVSRILHIPRSTLRDLSQGRTWKQL